MKITVYTFIGLFLCTSGCSLLSDDYDIDYGENISLEFVEGLNNDPKFKLSKDKNGFYVYELSEFRPNIQRITVRLLDDGKIVYSKCCGKSHSLDWNSNLFWWIMEGDTVQNVTTRYFNPFTGEFQYVNLPPLINWKEQLVPTVNPSSVTDEYTGHSNTVIQPIYEMKGDTLLLTVEYYHEITKQEYSSSFYESIGDTLIKNSVQIILK